MHFKFHLNIQYFLIYLVIINLLSLVVFSIDKENAKKNKKRVSERNLHFLELAGGVFFILPAIYIIRHKNRKANYFVLSFLIGIGWLILLFNLA
jgi:uncharacterized membrane protein YsdA (DUF1294 family)